MPSLSAFAGSVPANYDRYLGPVLFEPYALDLKGRLTGDEISALLELACGTGRVTAHLVSLVREQGFLTSTDLNPDMIDWARSHIADPRIRWQVANAQDLPFADKSFSHLVCQFGFMFFPDKFRAFREAHRVLKPGGRLVFNTWDRLEHQPRTAIMREVMEEALGAEAPDFLQKGPYSFYDTATISGMLEETGFIGVRVDTVSKTGHYNRLEDYMKGFVDGSPLSSYLATLPSDRQAAIREGISRALSAQEERYGNSVPMQAFVFEARRPS